MAKGTDDAIDPDVAAETMAGTEDEWEDVRVGLGRGWDFAKDGELMGLYLGPNEVQLKEPIIQDDGTERHTAVAHQFGLTDGSGEIVFVWTSYELDQALTEVGTNDKVKVMELPRESFTTSDGKPRQVRRYRVQRAKRN